MKLAFNIAYKNLVGAGLRTWLNVLVLSFSFVIIIFFNGMLDGWNAQAKSDSIAWEFGSGQLRHENYDPLDPFTLKDGHGVIPQKTEYLTPVLIQQATIYPAGRMMSVNLKGIDVEHAVLKLPVGKLKNSTAQIPAIIGKRMAEAANLTEGSEVLLRWRDKNGTFDAATIQVEAIFDTNVPTVDGGQIWIPINKMWEMTGLENHATLLVANENYEPKATSGWQFFSQEKLLEDITNIINMKKVSSSIMFIMLLAIALLAIFDTQVLSIFRRQKEIGTYVALGMTRQEVVKIFTVEGGMYSLFAIVFGSLYGVPLFIYLANAGIAIPQASQDTGIAIAAKIFPVYGFGLVVETVLLLVISATIVSYMPARSIAKLNPVNALKGKIQ